MSSPQLAVYPFRGWWPADARGAGVRGVRSGGAARDAQPPGGGEKRLDPGPVGLQAKPDPGTWTFMRLAAPRSHWRAWLST